MMPAETVIKHVVQHNGINIEESMQSSADAEDSSYLKMTSLRNVIR